MPSKLWKLFKHRITQLVKIFKYKHFYRKMGYSITFPKLFQFLYDKVSSGFYYTRIFGNREDFNFMSRRFPR